MEEKFPDSNEIKSISSTSEENLISSLKIKSNSKLKCLLCISALFSSKFDLMVHFKKFHSKIKSFMCEICDSFFPVNCIFPYEISIIKKHWKTAHPNYPQLQGLIASEFDLFGDNIDIENKIAKEISFVHFNSFKKLDKSVSGVSFTLQVQKAKKRKEILLSNEKNKIRKDETGRVITDVPKTYPCSFCPTLMASYTNLKKHINECHEKEPQYKCKLCSQIFWKQKELRRHRKYQHGIEEKITLTMCHLCGKQINQKDMKVHHLFVHSDKRDHVCDVCGTGFKVRNQLDIHMRRAHSEERPYRCKICFKTFKLPRSVRDHLRKTHKMMNLPKSVDADANYPVERIY